MIAAVGKEEIKLAITAKLQIILGWLESFEQRKNNNGLEMKIDHWVHDLQWDFVRNSSAHNFREPVCLCNLSISGNYFNVTSRQHSSETKVHCSTPKLWSWKIIARAKRLSSIVIERLSILYDNSPQHFKLKQKTAEIQFGLHWKCILK